MDSIHNSAWPLSLEDKRHLTHRQTLHPSHSHILFHSTKPPLAPCVRSGSKGGNAILKRSCKMQAFRSRRDYTSLRCTHTAPSLILDSASKAVPSSLHFSRASSAYPLLPQILGPPETTTSRPDAPRSKSLSCIARNCSPSNLTASIVAFTFFLPASHPFRLVPPPPQPRAGPERAREKDPKKKEEERKNPE